MTKIRRRILRETKNPIKTDKIGAKIKLNNLVKRAKENGIEQGPLTPIEALVTISQDEWIWQAVSTEMLDTMSHRLVFHSDGGLRREILMTQNLNTAMDAASIIVELDGNCVLIETLEP